MCIAHVSTVGVLEAKNKYQSWTGVTLSSCMGVSVPQLAPFDVDDDKHCGRITGDNP